MSANFMPLVYLHLAASVGVTAVSAEYPLTQSHAIQLWGSIAALFVSLFVLLALQPGPLKYIVFLVFLIAAGQLLGPLVERLQAKGSLRQVLLIVAGIFAGMTALAFYDNKGTFLGTGPYLIAGLLGLIIAELIGIVLGVTEAIGPKTFQSMGQLFSLLGTFLFTLYVAYDTQLMRKRAARKGRVDYVDASLGLYLDVLNLFSNIGSLDS
jgi:FtsH-binding integral membrane protein